jgi:hypothetical protein
VEGVGKMRRMRRERERGWSEKGKKDEKEGSM